jgi:hypothetical protein
MKHAACLTMLALALVIGSLAAQPEFTADGKLKRPADYREWIYLSSGLGMNYADSAREAANPVFDNVFVEPSAYRAFLATGRWPENTMFALELRQSAGEGSINKGGRFQTQFRALEIAVKDSRRFADGWGYFGFNGGATEASVFGPQAGCNACHNANGAVEHTFVQFYPTLLPVAREKGTLRKSYLDSVK